MKRLIFYNLFFLVFNAIPTNAMKAPQNARYAIFARLSKGDPLHLSEKEEAIQFCHFESTNYKDTHNMLGIFMKQNELNKVKFLKIFDLTIKK